MSVQIRTFSGNEDPLYATGDEIGRGSFGVVRRVGRRSDRKEFACKTISLGMMDPFARNQVMEEVTREISLLQQLRGCENCCQWESDIAVKTAHGRETEIRLYMKFYNGQNLANIMRGEIDKGRLPTEEDLLSLFEDLVIALGQCHGKGILHRDIKPANILLQCDDEEDGSESYSFHLVDFGVGKFQQMASLMATGSVRTGTPIYMAPESTGNNPKYSSKSDIFAVGCVMYEMAHLNYAFHTEAKTRPPTFTATQCDTELKSLIMACLEIDPAKRIDLKTLESRFKYVDSGRHELSAFVKTLGNTDDDPTKYPEILALSRKAWDDRRDPTKRNAALAKLRTAWERRRRA